MNLVNYARELSLFDSHAIILIFHIFMNVNKLLKPKVHCRDICEASLPLRNSVTRRNKNHGQQKLPNTAIVQNKALPINPQTILFSFSLSFLFSVCIIINAAQYPKMTVMASFVADGH